MVAVVIGPWVMSQSVRCDELHSQFMRFDEL
jgi:hypothetical protein